MAKDKEVIAKKVQLPSVLKADTDLDTITNALESADEGIDIMSEYLEFVEGEPRRLAVVGTSTMAGIGEKEGTTVPAIRFVGKNEKSESKFFVSAAAVLVSTLYEKAKKAEETGSLFGYQITLTGKKGSKGREYQTFEIKPLY